MLQSSFILVAGGSGVRFGSEIPKQFLPLGPGCVLDFSLELAHRFAQAEQPWDSAVLVLPEIFVEAWQEKLRRHYGDFWRIVPGGATRQASVARGLEAAAPSRYILVHDAARPFLDSGLLKRILQERENADAVVAALPSSDTLKQVDSQGWVEGTLARERIYRVQTPQLFRRQQLQEALTWAEQKTLQVTDEATLMEQLHYRVKVVLGSPYNFKITQPEDLAMAEALWQSGQWKPR